MGHIVPHPVCSYLQKLSLGIQSSQVTGPSRIYSATARSRRYSKGGGFCAAIVNLYILQAGTECLSSYLCQPGDLSHSKVNAASDDINLSIWPLQLYVYHTRPPLTQLSTTNYYAKANAVFLPIRQCPCSWLVPLLLPIHRIGTLLYGFFKTAAGKECLLKSYQVASFQAILQVELYRVHSNFLA